MWLWTLSAWATTEYLVGPNQQFPTIESALAVAGDSSRLRVETSIDMGSVVVTQADIVIEPMDPTTEMALFGTGCGLGPMFSVAPGASLELRYIDVTQEDCTLAAVDGELRLERVGVIQFSNGGVFVSDTGALTLFGGTFVGGANTAIHNEGTATVDGTVFLNVSEPGAAVLTSDPGTTFQPTTHLRGVVFSRTNDTASTAVAAVAGQTEVLGSSFDGYWSDLDISGTADVTVQYSLFRSTSAASLRSAVQVYSGTVSIDGSHFSESQADAGAFLRVDGGAVVVRDSRFDGGQAGSGGAVFASSAVTLERNAFCNNAATVGGAVMLSQGTLTNNLFAFDSAVQGSGVLTNQTGGGLTFVNNTVVSGSGSPPIGDFELAQSPYLFRNNLFVENGSNALTRSGANQPTLIDSDYNGFYASSFQPQWPEGPSSVINPASPFTWNLTPVNCHLGAALPDGLTTDLGDPNYGDPDGSIADLGISGGLGASLPAMVDSDEDGFSGGADCNENYGDVHPGAGELCATPWDDDCDGLVNDDDPGTTDLGLVYRDFDDDGYGGLVFRVGCVSPGWVELAGDCDNFDASVNPDAIEIPSNGLDDDCDGIQLCYADADGDGYVDPDVIVQSPAPCTSLASASPDCDDTDGSVNPGAGEICGDLVDNDCNGITDDGEAVLGFVDSDQDGWGIGDPQEFCGQLPTSHSALDGDCSDSDPSVYPDAPEDVCDGVDQDCDGFDACEPPPEDTDPPPEDTDPPPADTDPPPADTDTDGDSVPETETWVTGPGCATAPGPTGLLGLLVALLARRASAPSGALRR